VIGLVGLILGFVALGESINLLLTGAARRRMLLREASREPVFGNRA